MNIYLKHPDHGIKIASMEMEAEFDEQNGWIRYTLDTPSVAVIEDAAPVNKLDVTQRRRRTA